MCRGDRNQPSDDRRLIDWFNGDLANVPIIFHRPLAWNVRFTISTPDFLDAPLCSWDSV
jgi:hypothetical protein